jgi:hypothetical protein
MNMENKTKTNPDTEEVYRTENEKKGRERLEALEKIRGMWKDRVPDPIEELEEMRKEWDRDLG